MSQSKSVQDYIAFVNGWVAEGGPFAQVGQAFLDGKNITINNKDGSVSRRKGLVAAGTSLAPAMSSSVDSCRWTNVGPDTEDFIAVKVGHEVFFYLAGASTLPANRKSFTVDLVDHKVLVGTTAASLAAMRVSMVSVKGNLIIAGPLIETVVVSYNEGLDTISTTQISFIERDFDGISRDSVASDTRPSGYSAAHIYNLTNAGWPDSYIQQYKDSIGVYPSRAMSPWVGVQDRISPSSGYVTRVFRPSMFIPEEFGTSESPRGHFTNNIFNTEKEISDVFPVQMEYTGLYAENTVNNGDGSYTYDLYAIVRVTGGADTLPVGGTVTLSSFSNDVDDIEDTYVAGVGNTLSDSVNSAWTVTSRIATVTVGDVTTTTYRIDMTVGLISSTTGPTISDGLLFETEGVTGVTNPGRYVVGTPATTTVGVVEDTRFSQLAVFSGRVFYAGCPGETRSVLRNRVYYSQTFFSDYNLGRCYQENDPTARELNEVVDTDGGYIEIADMGTVLGLAPRKESMLILADNGVWEVKPGDAGYFTPTGYGVRKVSSFGMAAHGAFTVVDGAVIYYSSEGIKVIKDSEITALSEGSDLSGQRIRTYLEESVDYPLISLAYDAFNGIMYMVFDRTASAHVVVFDFRLGAFARWEFDTSTVDLLGIFCADRNTSTADPLFFVVDDGVDVKVAQLTNAAYVDTALGNSDDFGSFIETRYEIVQDGSRRKSLDRLVTFMKKEANASAWARAKYEWTTDGSSGKWNNKQQAYRDRGAGYDVAVSRLRMRGAGRSFRVRWESENGKPFTIYGYSAVLLGESEA